MSASLPRTGYEICGFSRPPTRPIAAGRARGRRRAISSGSSGYRSREVFIANSVKTSVIPYSADGSVEDAKYALGNLLGRLQVWLPSVHRYAKVWFCVRAPEITRVEPYSIEPLRIFPLAKCVGVREDVAAM